MRPSDESDIGFRLRLARLRLPLERRFCRWCGELA